MLRQIRKTRKTNIRGKTKYKTKTKYKVKTTYNITLLLPKKRYEVAISKRPQGFKVFNYQDKGKRWLIKAQKQEASVGKNVIPEFAYLMNLITKVYQQAKPKAV